MSNVFTRFFCPDSAAEEDFNTAMDAVKKTPPDVDEVVKSVGRIDEERIPFPCAGCRGVFAPDGMVAIRRIIIGLDDVIRIEKTSYCQKCKLAAPFELVIEDDDGDYLDSMAFRADNGYIQPVNDETGEDKILASLEEYSHLYCEHCGAESDWTLCKDCTRVKKAAAKEKKS